MKRKGSDFLTFFPDVRGTQHLHDLGDAWIVDFQIHRTPATLTQPVCGVDLPSLATGNRWLYWIPHAGRNTLLACLDGQDRPIWLYADLIAASGQDGRGFPWTDDLYLDVVALPSCTPGHPWGVNDAEIIDQDDLHAAAATGRVAPADVPTLLTEAESIRRSLNGTLPGLHDVQAHLAGHHGQYVITRR